MTIASADPQRADEVRSLVMLMSGVLANVVSVFEQSGVSLPERRYWTLATPAHDCEQLTVTFQQAYIGTPGDDAGEPSKCDGPRSASLAVEIVRCVPTVSQRGNRAPSAEQIQTGSEALAIDAWLLLDSAKLLDQWDPYGGPGLGVIATVDAREPQGGFQAVTMQIAMAIP